MEPRLTVVERAARLMCGIVGALGPGAVALTGALLPRVVHRGPDASGTWTEVDGSVALGHARLAVIGLGGAGAQPMVSPSGRYVLSYNGEAYEHLELRRRLEVEGRAPAWRGTSDTETLLACIDAWGSRRRSTAPSGCSPWRSGTASDGS